LENLKERIQQLKKKRPGYGEILDFYLKVREEQNRIKSILKIEPIPLKREEKEFLAKEGFPILEAKDFPIDTEASFILFQSLCQIGKGATPYLAEQARIIERSLNSHQMDLRKLFREWLSGQKVEKAAEELGVDRKVFQFLIEISIRPSIEVAVERLRNEFDPVPWVKTYCPICGSLPYLSLLKEEIGKRYLLCSFCGTSWETERLVCPFCSNKEQESLHYFCGEGEEAYRIDLCDQCHQYIKTIDLRNTTGSDLCLEDLSTLHLDFLASQKGYQRPTPTVWTI
jgi:FdhE protein